MSLKILIPLLVIVVIYFYFVLGDIIKSKSTKHFPKFLWIIICCISIPIGGIAYYVFGKPDIGEDNGKIS